MRYQTHNESPILSNLTLKLDIAKGSASCGIAVGEGAEVGDNDTTQCVSIFTTLSQQYRTARSDGLLVRHLWGHKFASLP
jgi:hypothetical protein